MSLLCCQDIRSCAIGKINACNDPNGIGLDSDGRYTHERSASEAENGNRQMSIHLELGTVSIKDASRASARQNITFTSFHACSLP